METASGGRSRAHVEGAVRPGTEQIGARDPWPDSRIVPVRAVQGCAVTAWACALPLGFLSGAIGLVLLALLVLDPREQTPSAWLLSGAFAALSLGSAWWLARGNGRLLAVIGRGLRLGALEWALLGVTLARLGPREAARALDGLHVALGVSLPVPGHETALVLATLCLVAVLAGSVLPRTLPAPVRADAEGSAGQLLDAG